MKRIRDVSELKTAIETESSGSEQRRRYILERAKALGRMDLVPQSFSRSSDNVGRTWEQTLNDKAVASGVDVFRIRCVYMRGLRDATASGISGAEVANHANTRVDAFIEASLTGNLALAHDMDLFFTK